MATDSPIWVGEVLIETEEVRSVLHPLTTGYASARLLLRDRRGPRSYATVPVIDGELCRSTLAAALHAARQQHRNERHGAAEPCSRFSVVVCTRNRAEQLRRVLADLRAMRGDLLEIIVVDNAPSDDSTRAVVFDVAATDGRVRYVVETTPGLSAARNAGLRAADSEWVAFTDDDVRVDFDWLFALAQGTRHVGVTCVTGLVAAAELETEAQQRFDARIPWAERLEPTVFRPGDRTSALHPYDAGRFGTGANFAVNRTFALKMGGFDELLGTGTSTSGGEDLDFLSRVILAGGSIAYEPAAIVWHPHPRTDVGLTRQLAGYGMGLGAYAAKLLTSGHAFALLRRAPQALAHVVRITARTPSSHGAADTAGGPSYNDDRVSELRGIVQGARAYAAVRPRRRTGAV